MNLEKANLFSTTQTFGRASSAYETDLAASIVGDERAQNLSHDIAPTPTSPVPGPSKIMWNNEETPDPTPDRKKKFRKGWAELKKKFKTSSDLDLVKQAKSDILELLDHTKVAYEDAIRTLDLNWDLLGNSLLPAFFEPLLIKSMDQRLSTKDGLLGVIWGLKNGKLRGDSTKITEIAEVSSMVSADLKLCSSEVRTFRESQDIAEKQWGAQSALISKYISKLEVMAKELTLKLEEPKPKENDKPSEPSQSRKKHPDGYITVLSEDTVISVSHPEEGTTRKVDNILSQARQLYGSKTLPFSKMTSQSPSRIVEIFKKNIKIYDRDVAKAMTATYSDLTTLI